jgi:septal ring factor EnvC (AmiA/AmiB activator)
MSPPVGKNEFNWTTVAVVVNIMLLVFGGGAAYQNLNAGLEAQRQAEQRIERDLAQIRADAVSREARLRAVETGAAAVNEKLSNIEAGISRIERQLTGGTP